MREGKPSQTAAMVAFLRALANLGVTSARGFSDPTAEHLLPRPWSDLYAYLKRSYRRAPHHGRWEKACQGTDLLAARTLEIDARLQEALDRGARQLVILGAGLDGRAFRLQALAGVSVFEVDHPATHAWKRERAAALKPLAGSLRFVPVNFERESLDDALESAHHDRTLPTAWIWEGVVMYLTDEAMRATLRVVRARSVPGSTIIIQYNSQNTLVARDALFRHVLLRAWGEPHIGIRSPETMAAELTAAGFRVTADTALEDWVLRFGLHPRRDRRQGMRVIVGVKEPG